jgi:hypothetical protein
MLGPDEPWRLRVMNVSLDAGVSYKQGARLCLVAHGQTACWSVQSGNLLTAPLVVTTKELKSTGIAYQVMNAAGQITGAGALNGYGDGIKATALCLGLVFKNIAGPLSEIGFALDAGP